MKTAMPYLWLLLLAGLTVDAAEDFGEETTTHGFIDDNEFPSIDSQPTSDTSDTTMKPSILSELEHAAWKILQLEWSLTSALQKRLAMMPLVKAIRMRSQDDPALARIIGLVEGGILGTNMQRRK